MVMSLLESLYKSLYKNVKDPALSIFRSPWRPEKSCVFAATVLDPSDTQRQTRTGRPFSCLYRTRPAAFCPYPGGLNFGQIGSASPSIFFYLYEVGSARAPKGFPWWTAGMKIDPRVPNTLIRKDYSLVNFTNIFPVSTQGLDLSNSQ